MMNMNITKKKILLSIPLAIIAGLLTYCWATILSTDTLAGWRHYVGLALFIVLIVLYFKSYKLALAGTGIYLLLATFNVLSMKAVISTSWLRIGSIETPPVQGLSLVLLLLFFILNFDALSDMYLDYKESKAVKKD